MKRFLLEMKIPIRIRSEIRLKNATELSRTSKSYSVTDSLFLLYYLVVYKTLEIITHIVYTFNFIVLVFCCFKNLKIRCTYNSSPYINVLK